MLVGKARHSLFSYIPIMFVMLLLAGCSKPQPKLKLLMPGAVILALGDSLTAGVGTTAQTSYPSDLEKRIGFKVVNAGVPGDETTDALLRLNDILTQTNPQLVIVCLGGNDLLRKRPLAQIKENLKKIIVEIRAYGAQVILIAVPSPSLNLKVPLLYAELGEEFKIPVNSEILPELLGNAKYKSDYIHLNQQGYQLFADDVARFLKEVGAV